MLIAGPQQVYTTLGVNHCWPTHGQGDKIVVKPALLSLAPFVNEMSLDTESQANSITATYDLFRSVDELLVMLTLDNTAVNPATCRHLNRPMIGAYCHRLNLASKC